MDCAHPLLNSTFTLAPTIYLSVLSAQLRRMPHHSWASDLEPRWVRRIHELCPALYVAAHLFAAFYVGSGLIQVPWPTPQAAFVRAVHLAKTWRKGVLSTRHAAVIKELRGPLRGLDRLPRLAWEALSCEPPAPPALHSFSELLLGDAWHRTQCVEKLQEPLYLPSSVPCPPAAGDCFMSFWRPVLEMKPAPFSIGDMNETDFLAAALREHLAASLAAFRAPLVMEFGVASPGSCQADEQSWSTKMIADEIGKVWKGFKAEGLRDAAEPRPTLYAFDTFQGLPRDWLDFPKGHFAVAAAGPPNISHWPDIAEHIEFLPGLFEETLLPLLTRLSAASRDLTVAVVHLDPDLYEAAKFVLETLTPYLRAGSLLIVDDIH